MTINGVTAVLLFVAAAGGALTVLQKWVWRPVNSEAEFRESLKEILHALTPDHGESLADFITETRETTGRVEGALQAHCEDAAHRMDSITAALVTTNHRIDQLMHALAGVALRRADRDELRTRATDSEGKE